MTESGWLNGYRYELMYDVIRKRVTTRQLRLYMVAACRLIQTAFFDPRITQTVDTAERCADDTAAEAIANAIHHDLVTAAKPRDLQSCLEQEIARVIRDA